MKSNSNAQSALSTIEKHNVPSLAPVKSTAEVDMKKVFINELKDIYIIQRTLISVHNRLVDKANSEQLADAIYDHLRETEDHTKRLEKLFSLLGVNTDEIKKNDTAALDFLKGKETLIEKTKNGSLRDTVIISASAKIKSYEIACFGSMVAFAKTLGENEIAILLNDILNEKIYADEGLTDVKEYLLNNDNAYEYTEKWQQE